MTFTARCCVFYVPVGFSVSRSVSTCALSVFLPPDLFIYTCNKYIYKHTVFSCLSFSAFLLLCAVSYEELYAFSYNPKQNDQQREEGWQLIDLGAEFERMGVPCDQWQLTDVNRDFKVDSWLYLINYNYSPSEMPNKLRILLD